MRIRQLIRKLQEYEIEFGNIEIVKNVYQDDIREHTEEDVDYLDIRDNSYDKRLKQETKVHIF